ncbi:M16 family metallopeptidase [Frigoriflavimonas asaccharolytica]|uniref:Putative Zn-dependent peptidase n=1 Tax=Frigoriflavimonas asaccharolytica TaxID=2735899 RepID=A0A8J8G9F0_9FLAO|nr:pitrilysin family protein [Frigoriflavimonas asaccharolytica]NRS91402.1 putative Zn-dependent peptidase [Frigoriflavimonas asaccharolytica]
MKRNYKYIAMAFLVSGMLSAQKIDINKMPTAGPTPVINIAQPKTFTLSNGMQVMVVENHKLPRVTASISMDRPPYYEGSIVGVSDIMSDQLGNGTTTMSKEKFNARVDYLGASLNLSSGGAGANTLSKYFPEILSMMADGMINPLWSAEEVENSKNRTIESLKSEEKSADAIAGNVSSALIYGKNSAMGEFQTEESVKKITLADVKNIYNKYYGPDNAYMVIVGDVKFDQVKSMVEKAFNGWKKTNVKYDAIPAAKNLTTTEIDIVDVPNAVQSVVSVNNVTDLKTNNPQYFAAKIANYILGGGGEARLFMNLREKNAFTYGAYSSLSTSKYAPNFSASSSVRNEVTDKAVMEFMNELKGITGKKVTAEELSNAKAKLKGDFIRSLEQPATIASFALSLKTQNLPSDFYTNYLKSIDKVTLDDVEKAAKTVILPGNSRIFVAGKASEISEGLEKLGYPVKYFDRFANPVAKPVAQKVSADVTVGAIADKYIAAIGGKANVDKVSSYSMNGTISMQGQTINMKKTVAKGGKEANLITMGAMTLQKDVFDGKAGYTEAQGQKTAYTAEQIAEKMQNKDVFQELGFANSASYKVAGIEKINGDDSYAVKNDDTTYYYSVKTGLKTGETSTVKTPQGEVKIPTTFSDYKEVNGVKMPFKIGVNQMGMDMTIEISSYDVNKATDADFK